MCFKWARVYQNFSIIFFDLCMEVLRAMGNVTGEKNLYCVNWNMVV
jgi:hypothetical protein